MQLIKEFDVKYLRHAEKILKIVEELDFRYYK